MANTMNTSPRFGAAHFDNSPVVFTSANTTAKQTLADLKDATLFAYGAIIESVHCTSDDTAAINFAMFLYDGSTDFHIGNINIPIGSGYLAVAAVEGMRWLSLDLGYIKIPPGNGTKWLIRGACVATMTAAKTLTVHVRGSSLKEPAA